MRKLSELYEEVYKESERFQFYFGICCEIWDCGLTKSESKRLQAHFMKGEHKFPMNKRTIRNYWFNSTRKRREYLEYLIKLCKEQDI